MDLEANQTLGQCLYLHLDLTVDKTRIREHLATHTFKTVRINLKKLDGNALELNQRIGKITHSTNSWRVGMYLEILLAGSRFFRGMNFVC